MTTATSEVLHPEACSLHRLLELIGNGRRGNTPRVEADTLYKHDAAPGEAHKFKPGDVLFAPVKYEGEKWTRLQVLVVVESALNPSGHGLLRCRRGRDIRTGDVFLIEHLEYALAGRTSGPANAELHVHRAHAGKGFDYDPLNPRNAHQPCPLCRPLPDTPAEPSPAIAEALLSDEQREALKAELLDARRAVLAWHESVRKGLTKKLRVGIEKAQSGPDLFRALDDIRLWSNGRKLPELLGQQISTAASNWLQRHQK